MIHLIKHVFVALAVMVGFLTVFSSAWAAPDNEGKALNNPQVVAYYATGTHAIVGYPTLFTGTDLVIQDGQSGNFQQWYTGPTIGLHSNWKWVGTASDCSQYGSNWDFVANANSSWGSYLYPGNYCVMTNSF